MFMPFFNFPRQRRKKSETIDITALFFGGNLTPLYINIFSAEPFRNYKQFLKRVRI